MKISTLVILFAVTLNAQAQYADLSGNGIYNFGNNPASAVQRNASLPTLTIIKQFASPTSGVLDIAFDGQDLWISSWGTNTIIKFSTANGAFIKSIPTLAMYPNGLEFDGTHLWMSNNTAKTIEMIDTSNGNVLFTHATPAMTTLGYSYPAGLTFEGADLWLNDPLTGGGGTNLTTQSDTMINVINSYNPVGYCTGLAFDGTNLWSSNNMNVTINQIDPSNYALIQSYNSPSTGNYPNGLTWDGTHLWMADNDVDQVYELEVVTGITEPAKKNFSLTVFPNPVINDAVIIYANDKLMNDVVCVVTDISGKQIFEQQLTGFSTVIKMDNMVNGIYFYSVFSEGKKMASGKLSVVHE